MIKKYNRHGYATGKVSKIYRRWYQMIDRCDNPKNEDYQYYGGRGIKVCKRWKDSIQNFIDDMGIPKEKMSLDRIKNNQGYSKSNCRWATRKEQMNNTRVIIRIMFKRKLVTIKELSKLTGIPEYTLFYRINENRKRLQLDTDNGTEL